MKTGWTPDEIAARRRKARYTAIGLTVWVLSVMLYTMCVFL